MTEQEAFMTHHDDFQHILGSSPSLELLLENRDYRAYHEAGVFIERDNTLFITSNQFPDASSRSGKNIQVSRVTLPSADLPAKCEEIFPEHVTMGNGGVNYENGILFCSQGDYETKSGLAFMETSPPYRSAMLLDSFYGRPFNSVNDLVVAQDGAVWFTDPCYGAEQKIKGPASMPCQVYRWDVKNGGGVRAVADGFGRCNGICFSPDEKIVYITDTDYIHGDGTMDDTRPSSIYAFDVVYYSGQPFLINRRLFAFAESNIPDGIKCDTTGNVYSGCDDGVVVWSPGGVLLGKIKVSGGAANFCFGRNGELFILNEHKLWSAKLGSHIRGALLGI